MNKLQLSHGMGLIIGLLLFSLFLFLPILTPLLVAFGMSLPEIGMIMATMGITVMLLELPTGGLADQIGRRKVFTFSMWFSVLSYLCLLLFPSFVGGVIGMFLWGASIALNSGTLNAWFVEQFNKAEGEMTLQKGFARVGFRSSLFGALGALSGSVVMFVGEKFGYSELTLYNFLMILALLIVLVVIVITQLWVKEGRTFDTLSVKVFAQLPNQIASGVKAIKHPVLWRILLALFLTIPIVSGIEKFWPIRFEALSGDNPLGWVYGLTYAAILSLGSLAAVLTNWLADKFNQQLGKVLFVSVLFRMIAASLLALSGHLYLFIVLLMCFEMSSQLGGSAYNQLLHQSADDNIRSTIDSVSSLTTRFGGVVGSLLCGFASQYIGLTNVWLVCVAISAGALLIYASRALNQPKRAEAVVA
ncbi:MFS transporter [Vibrio sp. S9_S30]|uniref:MFS transporter n=1 Tax=Vibrio sp. S9_S30 TaxID=2720226 RepID=UPI0016810952|nr:MFS transporter [Vibrio sp. S9_S30]MBD1558827.1 MFS transporter [Vibrio sp. S9_S30]